MKQPLIAVTWENGSQSYHPLQYQYLIAERKKRDKEARLRNESRDRLESRLKLFMRSALGLGIGIVFIGHPFSSFSLLSVLFIFIVIGMGAAQIYGNSVFTKDYLSITWERTLYERTVAIENILLLPLFDSRSPVHLAIKNMVN